jgi:two-component system chemotaxis sensor kinase CheA
VKSTIEKLNGSVEIFSEIGKGSTFNLRLPLTMAIVKALFIEAGEEIYAIPISNIVETIRLEKKDIQMVGGRKTTILRSDVLPLAFLRDILNIDEKEEHKTTMNAVVIQKEDSKIGLIVDRLIGEQEITIKNIGGTLKRTKGVAGVTITGDGRVVLVIDVNTLV